MISARAARGSVENAHVKVFTLFDISARFVTHIRCGLHHGNIQVDVFAAANETCT